MKLRNLFFAALSVFALTACNDTPESPFPGGGTGNGGGSTVTGDNLLTNSSFETWVGGVPTGWGQTVTNATYSQSTEANTGESAVLIEGNTQNKRLASKSYTLTAGTYTLAAHLKQSGDNFGQFRLGYAKLTNGAVADTQNDYIYLTSAAAVTANWKQTTVSFTLEAETELAIIVMNSKYGNGAAILVDDVILATVDGGIVEGTENEESGSTELPEGTYINEAFTNGFGVFTTQETIGNYAWVSDATYGAKASGYADGASQNAESWLISSAIDFSNETAAYIAFDYVINKGDANAAAANHKLLITSNYTGDVATTEWSEINYGAVNNNNWEFHNTGKIALPESMMGKAAVVIAFKYMSTTANSSTWEIKNVVVSSGTGATPEQPETPETPETPSESGEYTVAQALAAYVDGKQIPAIVTGYIVGAVNSKPESGSEFGTTTVNTNLLISDNPDTNDYTECLIVQLPKGNIRDSLNLANNPGNYQKQVKITGSIEKYFNLAGLKSPTAYEFTDAP